MKILFTPIVSYLFFIPCSQKWCMGLCCAIYFGLTLCVNFFFPFNLYLLKFALVISKGTGIEQMLKESV